MSILSRRYGGNRMNCDFYVVDASYYMEDGQKTFYMYSPPEWLQHIKDVYGNTWEDNITKIDVDVENKTMFSGFGSSKSHFKSDKYKIAAYAIVTDDYQFLFSPTTYVGPTFAALSRNSDEYLVREDVVSKDGTISFHDYSDFRFLNFNAPMIYGVHSDDVGPLYHFLDSLTKDDGYSNTKAFQDFFKNGKGWVDTSVNIYSEIDPDASINEVYGGPYLISTVNHDYLAKWPYFFSVFDHINQEADILDSYQPNDIEGFKCGLSEKRLTRYGVFPDKGYLKLNEFYIPSQHELKLIIKNFLIAVYYKNWFTTAFTSPTDDLSFEIEKLLLSGTSLSALRPPFNHTITEDYYDASAGVYKHYLSDSASLYEDLIGLYGGPGFYWSSTPYNWYAYPTWVSLDSNILTLKLNMYVAQSTAWESNLGGSQDYFKYKYGTYLSQNGGGNAYRYYIFDKYNSGYTTGRGGFNTPGKRSDINEGKLIACHRIPNNVKWSPISVGHPEIKRYN